MLPALPPALELLTCAYCPLLTVLPALPRALERLDCSEQISRLPALPATLVRLDYPGWGQPDVGPAGLQAATAWWKTRVAARHVFDRRHVASCLSVAALLYV